MIIPVFDISIHRPVIATDNLPPQYSSSQGMELVMEKFGLEETFPITLLFEYDTPVLEESNLKEINEFAEKLRTMEHVARVDHLTNVNETTSVLLDNGQDSKMTLMNIILDVAPDKDEARELVKTIRQEIIENPLNAKTYVTGETATGLDFDRLSIESLPYILLLVVVGTFVLLGIAFKSILIPLKAILMNGLVTAASMGLLVVLFQYGTVPGTEPLPINASTPIILFTVLFGLSMDYEVILISRIKEFYTRGETMENSVIYGVQRTSGMINGAASIMIVVFGVFIFADLQLIQELGVGLAIAVFLDAVVIRSYLVPVTMILLGKWNWWTPRLFKARNNKTSM